MQLNNLEGFYWVARCGGYTRAAREFPYPITQPGVYQQVRKLELELGVKLFQRAGRDQVIMTSAGRKLFEFCAPFFEQLPSLARTISQKSYGGVLRIDAAALEIRYIVPNWIKRLRSARPDVVVDLQEIETPNLDRLQSGHTDLVVDYFSGTLPKEFDSRPVATHSAFLIVPSGHPKAKLKSISVRMFADEAFVSFHPDLPHSKLQLQGLGRAGLEPERLLSASSTEAIIGFVQAGLGYSLIPWPDTSGPRVSGVRAVKLRGPGTSFPCMAIWRRSSNDDPLVRAALTALESARSSG